MSYLSRVARPALVAALVLAPSLALAQTKHGSVELAVLYTYTHFDKQTSLDYKLAPSVLFGYNFTKRHGMEVVFNSQTATPKTSDSFPVDVDTLRVGYLFNAYPKPKIVSFFRFGLGAWVIDPEIDPNDTGVPGRLQEGDSSLMIYTGGGVRFFITEHVGIRFAASIDAIDSGQGSGHPDIQATGDLGLVFAIGGRQVEEPPAPEPKDESAPGK